MSSAAGVIRHGVSIATVLPIGNASPLPALDGARSVGRRINSNYTGPIIAVRRSTDNVVANIGYNGSDDLDQTALLAHVTSSGANPTASGFVQTIYDQSQDAAGVLHHRDYVNTTAAQQYRIVLSGVVEKVGGKVVARAPDQSRGYLTAPFTAYTGSAVTGFVVGAIQSQVTTAAQRMLSLIPTNTALNDIDISGATLIGRDGTGGAPIQGWKAQRNSAIQCANDSATYGQLEQVTSQINAAVYGIKVDGTLVNATGTTSAAFNFARHGLSHSGSAPCSAQDAYFCEDLISHTALSSTDQTTFAQNQQVYWGTATQSNDPSAPYTLVAQDNFDTNVINTTNFSIYGDYGSTTSAAGWWMKGNVDQLNGHLRIHSKKLSAPDNGRQRETGAWLWKGDPDGHNGSAFKKGGMWHTEIRMDSCGGFGFALLLWPAEGNSFAGNAAWPINGEIDVVEVYSTNPSRFGGESNWHYDTVAGSGRHLKAPGSSTHSPSGLVTAGNYQIDWTVFHDVKCLWIPGQRVETFVDNVSVGYTTDPTYVPSGTHNGVDVPFRLTLQGEPYGTPDSAADLNDHLLEANFVKYYALP